MPLINFYNDYETNPAQAQAGYIWNMILEDSKNTPVAIIYAANNLQAEAIYEGYMLGKTPIIEGHRQALVFNYLTGYINNTNRSDRIHILPIATSLKGGEDKGNNCIEEHHIIRDLQNIKNHLEAGWTVIALSNPENLKANNRTGTPQKYQIGGGASKHFYSNKYLTLSLKRGDQLSPGHFVEAMLDTFQLAYSKNSQDDLQLMLFAQNRVKDKLPYTNHVVLSIKFYLCLALKQHNLKLSDTDILSVKFSPSYNLRIICANENIQKKVQDKLDRYDVKCLNEQREKTINKKSQMVKKEKDKYTLSVHFPKVISLLRDYCQLSPGIIASYYEAEIMRRNSDFHSVKILAELILINKTPYTIESCIQNKMFHYSAQKLKNILAKLKLSKDNGEIQPDNIKIALQEIMSGLSLSENNCLKKSEYLYPLWQLHEAHALELPATDCRQFDRIWSQAQHLGSQPYHAGFRQLLFNSIRFHYLSMAIPIYHLFQQISVDDCINKSPALLAAMNYSSKVSTFIQTDILIENQLEQRALKFWIYIQTALQAFIDGNHFLLLAIVLPLTTISTELKLTCSLISTHSKQLLAYLENKIRNQTLVRLSLAYRGICVPQVGAFNHWIEMAKGGNQEDTAIIYVRERLEPILANIKIYKPSLLLDEELLQHIQNQTYRDMSTLIKNVVDDEKRLSPSRADHLKPVRRIFETLELSSLSYDLLNTHAQILHLTGDSQVSIDNTDKLIRLLENHQNISPDERLFLSVLQHQDFQLAEKILQYKLIFLDQITLNSKRLNSCIDSLPIVAQVKIKALLHRYTNIKAQLNLTPHDESALSTSLSSPWRLNSMFDSVIGCQPSLFSVASNSLGFFTDIRPPLNTTNDVDNTKLPYPDQHHQP